MCLLRESAGLLCEPQGPEGSGVRVSRTLLSAHRASAARVGRLQEALSERHSVISALKAK